MGCLTLLIAATVGVEPVVLDRPVPQLISGPAFREALQRDMVASWDNVELRAVLRRLQAERQVAVLLDRRIDPNAIFPVRFTGEPLHEALAKLAAEAEAAVSFPEHVAYVGPPEPARWLYTAIEQAEAQLAEPSLNIPERRQFELSTRRTVHWQDLSTPREILRQIAEPYRLQIDGLDQVPHDLWASATLPPVSVAAALTLVLVQFDLGWDWQPGGERVQIRPWTLPALIERRYSPRGNNATDAARIWSEALPDAEVRLAGRELVVRGRAEDHHLANILRTTGALPKPAAPVSAPVPLRRRLFTLKIERVPIRAVLKELEKTGAVFVVDEAALKSKGKSLDDPVSLDVQKADADAFFRALLAPLGAHFEIDNLTVTIRPPKGEPGA